jgi:hypothetical protein
MMPLVLAPVFGAVALLAQDMLEQKAPPLVAPGQNKALDNAIERMIQSGRNGMQFKVEEREGRCYFIATRPVQPGPDKGMVRAIPAAPSIDNMPVMKPGPTCSTQR